MPIYRLYFLSLDHSHIEGFQPVEADDPEAAIEAAKLYRGQYPLELWYLDQKIASFERKRDSAGGGPP